MQLSNFIRSHCEEIAQEWEDFARTVAPVRMNIEQLRDHVVPLLQFIADDMDEPQSERQQKDKGQGKQPRENEDTEAELHGAMRVIDGFAIDQVVGEFRALRASILRLWSKYQPADIRTQTDQITRFNESIDQMLSESVVRHGELEAERGQVSLRRDAFLLTLSHELRNPLGAIRSAAHLVKAAGTSDASLARVATVLEHQTAHMAHLLDDLLDVARISRNSIQLRIERSDIREWVQDALDVNRDRITQKAQVLRVDMPEEPLVVACDGTRIVQIVSNLLHNAVRYSPNGSTIEVSLSHDEEHVIIAVKDDGMGIDTTLLSRIFDPFSFSHADDLGKSGLGIGLWLTRSLVELHGGTIVAKSAGQGRGAEFCVTIPLRPATDV